MAREDPQTNIRLPAELKERLMDAAKKANRTFGAEVVMRLETSFNVGSDEVLAIAQANMERVEEGLAEIREMRTALEQQLAEAREYLATKKKR